MMSNIKEVHLNDHQSEIVFKSIAASGSVLVGGQALQLWIDYYNLPINDDTNVTIDTDILGDLNSLDQLSIGLIKSGESITPKKQTPKVISALVGVITIHNDDDVSTIDVIHKIAGMDKHAVIRRAVELTLKETTFKVMHPIDVMESRLRNVSMFEDRRSNPRYILQCELSCQVVSAYLSRLISDGQENLALKAVEAIVIIAKTEPGKMARKLGIDLFDFIPLAEFKNENFLAIRAPQLRGEIPRIIK